ncbi:unnamed protein product [Linum trigynum]|uniref:Uncharacterized protein n=1 Tax=Linum trigynum TaxID=586398 RepID=A0AAV2GK02_9ROSI
MISLQVRACSSSFQGEEILLLYSKNALKSPSLSRVRPLGVWDPKTQLPPPLARIWVKNSHSRLARPGCTAVHITILAVHLKTRRINSLNLSQLARPNWSLARPCVATHNPVRAHAQSRTAKLVTCTAVRGHAQSRACPRTIPHGQTGQLHGRAGCGCARATSSEPRHASDPRPIDPRLAPKPSFTS